MTGLAESAGTMPWLAAAAVGPVPPWSADAVAAVRASDEAMMNARRCFMMFLLVRFQFNE